MTNNQDFWTKFHEIKKRVDLQQIQESLERKRLRPELNKETKETDIAEIESEQC